MPRKALSQLSIVTALTEDDYIIVTDDLDGVPVNAQISLPNLRTSIRSDLIFPSGTDDTAVIQAAIDAANVAGGGIVTLAPGAYTSGTLTLKSNVQLFLQPGVTITSVADLGSSSPIIQIGGLLTGAVNASIIGYGATLTMAGQYTSGEHRHGIYIQAGATTSQIVIKGLKITECGGDGIAMTADAPTDVTVEDCWFDKNRRQGCSIIGGDNVVFTRCRFTDTGRGLSGGTSPQAGADIEPLANRKCRGITFRDCVFENNVGSGLTANANLLDAAKEFSFSVTNCMFRHNYGHGIMLANVLSTHTGGGHVLISGCDILDSGATGIYIIEWASTGPKIIIRDCKIQNGNIINSADFTLRSHIAITRIAGSALTYNMGNILVDGCEFRDTRASTDTGIFAYTAGTGTQPVVGTTVVDDTNGATGTVVAITVTGGTWAGNNAAGSVTLRWQAGTFVSGHGVTFSTGGTATCSTVTAAKYIYFGVYGIVSAGTANIVNTYVNDCTYSWAVAGNNAADYLMSNGVYSQMRCNLAYAGTPEAHLAASVGSMYRRTDGGSNTTLYIKEANDTNTGWAAI